MGQASDFEKNQTNWNVDKIYGGGPYGYQFGSTAKVFGLVTALEKGMPINGTIRVPFATAKKEYVFDGPKVVDAPCGANEPWPVTNDYAIGGRQMTLAEGISKSINTWAAQLTIDVGPCDVLDTMAKMGVHRADGKKIDGGLSDATLGSGSTTPLDLASAYATLAAGGKHCEPSPIVSITTPDKKEIKVPKTSCKQVISEDTANAATYLLKGTLRPGGTAQGVWNVDQRPAAGKTGTTEKHNQGWFVGYTPQVAAAVWIGNVVVADKNRQLYSLNGKCFGSYGCFSEVFGGTVSAPVWAATMKKLTAGMEPKDFPAPSQAAQQGNLDPLPNVFGRSPESAAAILKDAGFGSAVGATISQRRPGGHGGRHLPLRVGLQGLDRHPPHLQRSRRRPPRSRNPQPTQTRRAAAPAHGRHLPRAAEHRDRRGGPDRMTGRGPLVVRRVSGRRGPPGPRRRPARRRRARRPRPGRPSSPGPCRPCRWRPRTPPPARRWPAARRRRAGPAGRPRARRARSPRRRRARGGRASR